MQDNAKRAVHLFKTNLEVDAYNVKRVKELTRTEPNILKIDYRAKDIVIGALNKSDKTQALHSLKDLSTQKTYGLPMEVSLQLGVRYMVSTNIDVSDGLFNGASGILRFIEQTNKGPQAVWLEFDTASVGANARMERKRIMDFLKLPNNLTPVCRLKKTFRPTRSGQAQVIYKTEIYANKLILI